MERRPEVKSNWEITGRRYLFMLSQQFGSRVAKSINDLVDTRLKANHKEKWPLYRND
jgi:hypothetical protein